MTRGRRGELASCYGVNLAGGSGGSVCSGNRPTQAKAGLEWATRPHIRDAGYETKKIATSFVCYQAMGQAVKDLYKDELLKEAGIDV